MLMHGFFISDKNRHFYLFFVSLDCCRSTFFIKKKSGSKRIYNPLSPLQETSAGKQTRARPQAGETTIEHDDNTPTNLKPAPRRVKQ
jgi:hypothetical protein